MIEGDTILSSPSVAHSSSHSFAALNESAWSKVFDHEFDFCEAVAESMFHMAWSRKLGAHPTARLGCCWVGN